MSEYLHVEKPFLDQLAALGWTVIDQGYNLIPSNPTKASAPTSANGYSPKSFARPSANSTLPARTVANGSPTASSTTSTANSPATLPARFSKQTKRSSVFSSKRKWISTNSPASPTR